VVAGARGRINHVRLPDSSERRQSRLKVAKFRFFRGEEEDARRTLLREAG
jgi:hypothetical protein